MGDLKETQLLFGGMGEPEAGEEATGVQALSVLFVLCFCDFSPVGPLSFHLPITLCHLQSSSQMQLPSRHHPATLSLRGVVSACSDPCPQAVRGGGDKPPGHLCWRWVMGGCHKVGSVGRDNHTTELQVGSGLPPAVAPSGSIDLPSLWAESLPLKLPWQGLSKCGRVTEDVCAGGGIA